MGWRKGEGQGGMKREKESPGNYTQRQDRERKGMERERKERTGDHEQE